MLKNLWKNKSRKDNEENFVSSTASLVIFGSALDFYNITETLKIQPTRIIKKGEIISKVLGTTEYDTWIYQSELEKGKPLIEHLEAIKLKLENKVKEIKSIEEKNTIIVRCSYHSNLAQGSIILSPNIMSFYANINIPIEISTLSWGEV